MAYLELPLIAIAAVGTIIAIVIAQRDLQLKIYLFMQFKAMLL